MVPNATGDSFNSVADQYAEVRPGYPEGLYDYIVREAGLGRHSTILEIGCGPANATLPFARRGFGMVCIEPGGRLAEIARDALQPYPAVAVEQSRFEDWNSRGRRFSLLFAAQAYHWIHPRIAAAKPYDVLQPNGRVALVWNVPQREATPVRAALDDAYDRHAPALSAKLGNFAGTTRKATVERFATSNLYAPVGEERFTWHRQYAVAQYLRLLGTFSDHLALDASARANLFEAITLAIRKAGGSISVTYDTMCYLFRTIGNGEHCSIDG